MSSLAQNNRRLVWRKLYELVMFIAKSYFSYCFCMVGTVSPTFVRYTWACKRATLRLMVFDVKGATFDSFDSIFRRAETFFSFWPLIDNCKS